MVAQKQGCVKDRSHPSRNSERTKVTGTDEIAANSGHQKGSFSRGAECAFKHDDVEERDKETSDGGRQPTKKTAWSRNQKSETGQAHKPVRKRKPTSSLQLQTPQCVRSHRTITER